MKTPALGTIFPAILVFCAPWSARAVETQPAVPVEKSGPTLASEIILSGGGTIKSTNSEYRHVSFYHANWGVNQAFAVDETSTLTLGLNYGVSGHYVTEPSKLEENQNDWRRFKEAHPDWEHPPLPQRLQAATASIEYARQINDLWSLNTNLCAGSYVATKGLLAKGHGVSTSVMALYKWSTSTTIAFGAAYDSLSHDYRLVPLLGFDWQLTEKWSVAIGFPSTSVAYVLNKHLTFALDVSGSGGTYYVQDDPSPGTAPSSLANSKLESTEVRLGLKAIWKINDTFTVSGTMGNVLYREYKYIDRGFRLRSHDTPGFSALSGTISF